MHQAAAADGRWLTKLAVTGFASCWHFSAASRDPREGRFASVREYFERAHERGLEHCLCTEVCVWVDLCVCGVGVGGLLV